MEGLEEVCGDEDDDLDLDFDPLELVREAKPPIERQIASLNGLVKRHGPEVGFWIALVPCCEPWEVPAI